MLLGSYMLIICGMLENFDTMQFLNIKQNTCLFFYCCDYQIKIIGYYIILKCLYDLSCEDIFLVIWDLWQLNGCEIIIGQNNCHWRNKQVINSLDLQQGYDKTWNSKTGIIQQGVENQIKKFKCTKV